METMGIFLVILTVSIYCLAPVSAFHPECRFMLEIHEEEIKCKTSLSNQAMEGFKGCRGIWDNITCWRPAEIGEIVTVACPNVFRHFFKKKGNISKNCTRLGWSEIYPNVPDACGYDENVTSEHQASLFGILKTIYTLGHSVSLVALTTGSIILCVYRKLHCTRNYIHLNLFLSFIIKAVVVLVKDSVFFPNSPDCRGVVQSLVGCQTIMVFLHYCAMANFYWLLVEGLYLHTLLVVIFSPNRHLMLYLFIGWGIPTIFTSIWIVTRVYLEDNGCWDENDNSVPWWVLKLPILISIIVNFFLFINIIRILLQKLMSPDIGGNEQSQYKRLAKSTLLLIPLFGVHYIVFAVLSIPNFSLYQIWFELCIGSFQGLVVAVLYCFLNSEVQGELKRKWRSLYLNRYLDRDYRLHSCSISRNGSESVSHFPRNSRAESFLQTETTVI
ncbi:vasoactive intestinal polypeptide receptor 2 [Pleurodeles waltl]|uniref:vasoactive intestinal polypeptide receptor 2 n=1 Tax=Pleurodeles waltl TaxID=8319 RepID=UPI003709987A